jgi:hypothetical protein
MGSFDRECLYCNEELKDTYYFCDENCEHTYRNENQELYIKMKSGTYEWICPTVDFKETDTHLICHNGQYQYEFNKQDVDKWKLDKCSCCQEFDEIDIFNI